MRRKIEFGCLLILTIVWLSFIGVYLFAQGVTFLQNGSYSVEYRPDLGIPTRVDWMISDSLLGSVKRTPAYRFKADGRTPRPRITSALYTRSGYQRGHLCPAADRSASKDLMRSTFLMSNVCPMTPDINTGAWKVTEEEGRALARRGHRVNVTAGPLFFPQDTSWIGGHRVAVPHAFIKFMWTNDELKYYNFWIIENKWKR